MQSLDQVVALSIRRGARDRSVGENIALARSMRSDSVSGEHSEKMSRHLRQSSSHLADVIREQLGMGVALVMSDGFDNLVDWLDGAEDSVSFPYLEAMLIMSGHPSALVRN